MTELNRDGKHNEQFFRETFLLPQALIDYHVSQSLKQLFPQKGCIEVECFLKTSTATLP